ncbi:hypothetical protein Ancab_017279 [Ancistrocladus abbreviatus]
MHDEAAAYYIDMIDQTTLGHRFIKEQFNKTPRAGWQIDPFGHSAVHAYLLGAELGFNSVHFARIDYQDKGKRKRDKTLEVIWHGSHTFRSSSQIFVKAFFVHYGPPPGFHFEVNDDVVPIQDNLLLDDYNVEQRVNDFIQAATTQYQYAETWFKQMDKFIHYVNKDGRVNVLYSTPSIYTDSKYAANETWPLKSHDYFPYADREHAYWTGFFSSRPGFKRYVRALSGYYLAARQFEFFAGRRNGANTYSLGDALGIAQHHDAITGTSKQHTTDDYAKRLVVGAHEAEAVVNSALSCLVSAKSVRKCAASTVTFGQCQLLNISYCPPTEQDIPEEQSLVVLAYNPLGWTHKDTIRIPVNDSNLVVQDSLGNIVESQFINMDNVSIKLRSLYAKAYLGISLQQYPKYWLFFRASVPPLGWNTHFISKTSGKGQSVSAYLSMVESPQNQTVEIGPGNLKMSFSLSSGLLTRMFNFKTGVDVSIQQGFSWYPSSTDFDQVSSFFTSDSVSCPCI